jgi:hypothetical protein
MNTIQIENIGPIHHLSIPLPDGGGVVVLRGRNGVGKSHALAAVDSLIAKRGKPPCRDGAAVGVVEGCGVRLTIGRSTRRTGEAEVLSLEGRLDISQLVSPPIKDEEAADRQRVKALVQLSGAAANEADFAGLLPDGYKLRELVGPTLDEDPVALAGQVKRALEAEARREETVAESYERRAEAQVASHKPIDPQLPTKERAIRELQDALLKVRELETLAKAIEERRAAAEEARQRLQELSVQRLAVNEIRDLEHERDILSDDIARLQEALAIARDRHQRITAEIERARKVADQIKELEPIVLKVPDPVPAEQIEAARRHAEACRQRMDAAVRQDLAIKAQEEASRYLELARSHKRKGELLREAARATDHVLSQMVGRVTSRLRVEQGRLVCDTDRGAEPFSELSPGERWRIALEIAAEQVGRGGLVTVPQEAWEALDPQHRAEITTIAHQVGIVILTAEADAHEEIVVETA